MDPATAAQYDQQKAKAADELVACESFLVITSPNYSPGQHTEVGDDFEVEFRVVMGCDDFFVASVMDTLARNMVARRLLPDMFDEWGRVRRDG